MKKQLLSGILTLLSVGYAFAQYPRPEYPRPQFERREWVNLNGPWSYTFDFVGSGMERNLNQSQLIKILLWFRPNFITHINRFVEENIENSEFAVADITRESGISRTVLHVKMKSLFGTSISDFIRDKRLEYAKQLMIKGCNVSETAYGSGYSNPNYFAKVFKKQFGITPSEFIQQS